MAKPETSEQQQSYFYVVWPEDRSPAAGATASSTPNLIAMNAAGSSGAPIDTFLTPSSSSPPGYSGQGTHSSTSASSLGPLIGATGHSPSSSAAGTGTAAALSGTEDSDSSAAGSPATTNTSQTASTAIAAAAQTITVTDSGEFSGSLINTSTTPHNVLISPRSHAFGLATNGAGTITTVYNPVSSPGLIYVSDASSMLSSRSTVPASYSAHHNIIGHHHHLSAHHPAAPGHRGNGSSITGPSTAMLQAESPRKHRHSHPSSTEVPPLRNIGTWAEQAMGNLQKIIKAVSAHDETSEEGGPARKRVCVRDIAAHSQPDCLECEVKDAEINVLRKRVLALQDQVSAMQRLPNGNVKSPLSPSSVSPTPQQMEATIQLQIDPMHHVTKELLQQQRRRSRPASEHPSLPDPLSSGTPPELQAQIQAQPQPQHQPQPGEAVELVSGSGVYILAYRLQEARREAKTGTQLARKLMDCFWDKETLAKSTLTPRSKFQYQQLDPKIIKAIEVYCLNYDAGAQSKDIHATMTDKCCQARSRTRGFQ